MEEPWVAEYRDMILNLQDITEAVRVLDPEAASLVWKAWQSLRERFGLLLATRELERE